MVTWQVDLYALNGVSPTVSAVPFRKLNCNWVLNSPGALTFDCNFADVSDTDFVPGARELKLLRNGTLVWGGYLWMAHAKPWDRKGGVVTFTAQGYASRLRKRMVTSDLVYTDTADSTICWNFINHVQGQTDGNMGFTDGADVGTSATRDFAMCVGDYGNVYDAITELSGTDDGFDWVVNEAKAFKTWHPDRGAASGITVSGSNLMSFDYDKDATNMATYVTGVGTDDCSPYTFSDNANSSTYGRLDMVRDVESNSLRFITHQTKLELKHRKAPIWRADATYAEGASGTPSWAGYDIGDTLTATNSDGYSTFSKTLRVVEREAIVEPRALTKVRLTLDDK